MERKQKEIKAALRKAARKLRDGLAAEVRGESSRKICSLLLEWEVFQEAQSIYFYYPLGSEVDLLPAAREALKVGKQVAFPKTCGDEMDFYRVTSMEEFQEGAFHVMEPVGQEAVQEKAPLILVPGLAFDRDHGRIGYGKAYYDRYFQQFPDALKVGVCFEAQLVDEIPLEAHDIRLDHLVTERGIG